MRCLRHLAAAVLAALVTGAALAAASDVRADADAAAPAGDAAALFEFGRAEALAGRHDAAVHAFETLLARADSPRVRLELARSLAALGRRDEALAAYRAVLDAHPPEPVDGWVLSEMAALSARAAGDATQLPAAPDASWTWHPRAGVGALADSNVNAGPADANVQIFGLPFELSADSLAQRDAGAQAWLALGGSRVGDWGRWHVDAQWAGTRYRRHGDFSSDAFDVQAGLARASEGHSLDVTLAFDSQLQRNGNGRDTATLGAQGLDELSTGSAIAWLAAAGHIHQHQAAGADGGFVLGGASLNLRHAFAAGDASWLPPAVEALIGVRVLRESLQDADRSHVDVTPQVALQAAIAGCDGCTVTLDATRTESRYDDVDAAFGLLRRDRLRRVSLTFARAAPAPATAGEVVASWQCVVERSVNASTLSAYAYDRTLLRCSREWIF
jgi:tetratricopeptide (TPR) repeat protein